MEYNHIKDCWNRVWKVKSLKELDRVLEEFPIWSGSWYYELFYYDNSIHCQVWNSFYNELFEEYEDTYDTIDLEVSIEEVEDLDLVVRDEDNKVIWNIREVMEEE